MLKTEASGDLSVTCDQDCSNVVFERPLKPLTDPMQHNGQARWNSCAVLSCSESKSLQRPSVMFASGRCLASKKRAVEILSRDESASVESRLINLYLVCFCVFDILWIALAFWDSTFRGMSRKTWLNVY
jgi:hypothetical protein